jgi:4-amino-4-deoxy-L-arabinose transferase-like glycosyltransferase
VTSTVPEAPTPATATATTPPTLKTPASRRVVWWRRIALFAIAALAAALYAWNIASSGYPVFYSMAVKSMSVSWKAFVYGAVDPQASLTIDKLAGSFVPQAISVRIFGFHQWSLALPQVIEGVVATLVLHRIVRRWTGSSGAGLFAAAVLAFTPVIASMFEHSMEDGALTMCLVVAADRYQYAVMNGKLRSLVFSGVWVGVAFQAKMLEAWLILPALAVGYLLAAPGSRGRRVRDVLVAGAAMLLASLSWVLLYVFTPSSDRPYIDGTTNNNPFSMVFGYNGLARAGIHLSGAISAESVQGLRAALEQFGIPQSELGNIQAIGTSGWGKLFGEKFGPEVGWLFPLAFLALVAGLWWTRRTPRTDQVRAGFVFWGLWLVCGLVLFSAMTIPHTAYVAVLAPPVAALSAAGIALYWRTWLLPVAIAAEAAWTVYLAHDYGSFLPWLTPTVLVFACVAFIGTLFALLKPTHPLVKTTEIRTIAVVLGVVAMLASPFAWAASTLDSQYSGSAVDATAGPVEIGAAGGTGVTAQQARALTKVLVTQYAQVDTLQHDILGYVDAEQQGSDPKYVLATDDWLTAQPYVDGAGADVLPMGGFSTEVPYPSLAQVQSLVADRQLSYFLLDRPGTLSLSFVFGTVGGGPTLHAVDAWVRKTCVAVPATAYGIPALDVSRLQQTLYHCS